LARNGAGKQHDKQHYRWITNGESYLGQQRELKKEKGGF